MTFAEATYLVTRFVIGVLLLALSLLLSLLGRLAASAGRALFELAELLLLFEKWALDGIGWINRD